MHTTPKDSSPTTAELRETYRRERLETKIVMQRAQKKALEILMDLMDEPEPTGDPKKDAIEHRERNRRRLAANQALIHCRTAQREQRIARNERLKLNKLKPRLTSEDIQLAAMVTEGLLRLQLLQDQERKAKAEESQSPEAATPTPAPDPNPSPPIKPFPTQIGRTIASQIISAAGSTRGVKISSA
jgi:hypothetical protein